MRRKRASAQRGFTLLELVVALTVVGLISMVVFGGLRLGTRTWDTARVQLAGASDVHAVQNFLRLRLADARPVPAAAEGDAARVPAFDGGAGRLAFVGTLPPHVAPGGLYRLEVRMEPAGGGSSSLVLDWRRMTGDGWRGALATGERVLLERVGSVRFSYFGAAGADQPGRWHDAWQGAPALPRLVRLEVSFPEGDKRSWPEMTVAIPARE